jgi:hypothetical protein
MEHYIIKPGIDIRYLFEHDSKIVYIATSKNLGHLGGDTTVHFYGHINGSEGIFARGLIMDFPVMSRHVPAAYQEKLYAKQLRQFPLYLTMFSSNIYIDKKYLFQFPAMNMYVKADLAKPDYLYQGFHLEYQLNFIKYKYDRYCNPAKDHYGITDGHYRLWFHELREYVFEREYGYVTSA